MKKTMLMLAALITLAPVFSQTALPVYRAASGDWKLQDLRLYQNDPRAPLAKVNFRVPQEGPMLYEFNVRYEGGGEDGHGGFGLHLFVKNDQIYHRASWGSGNSYLLWLNYDENPQDPQIPAGLSAQVYHSLNTFDMELVESVDLNYLAAGVTVDDLADPVPFVIWMDGSTGEIRVYDPTDSAGQNYLSYFIQKTDLPQKGDWISLRTNGVKLSFGL
ncbi:MAG: hypothetical protein LBS64_03580 [Spirochaetaceae bacterium]|jgi:hypothetical protein|nr:hypothetical protein [Spirochaetaceae bacterium]